MNGSESVEAELSKFRYEFINKADVEYDQILEQYYYTYQGKRNTKLYSRETLTEDINVLGRFNLGIVNVWYNDQLLRTMLLSNYNNWVLLGRSISFTDVSRVPVLYFLHFPLLECLKRHQLSGILASFNSKKYVDICLNSGRHERIDRDDHFKQYLRHQHYNIIDNITFLNDPYEFYYVPQYIAYYSPTGNTPLDFLKKYDYSGK